MKRKAVIAAGVRGGSPRLGKVLEFMRLLWAVDHGLQSVSKRMHGTLGVTGLQRLVLRLVGRFPGISAGSLAEILHDHPSTLTAVLKKLVSRSLLRRRRDPEDGRRVLLELTERGRSLDVPHPHTVEGAVRRALAGVPPEQLEAARVVLSRIAAELQREMP